MARNSGRRRMGGDEEAEESDERWLLTYADMITLLMALFMVLFSISSVNIVQVRDPAALAAGRVLRAHPARRPRPAGERRRHDLAEGGGHAADLHAGRHRRRRRRQGRRRASRRQAAAAKAEEKDFKALKARVDAYAAKHGLASKVTTIVTKRRPRHPPAHRQAAVRQRRRRRCSPAGAACWRRSARLLRAENQHVIRVRGFTDPVPIHTAAFPSNWELSAGRAASVVRAFAEAGVAPERLEAAGRAALDPLTSNATALGRARNRRVEVLLPRVATGAAAAEAEKASSERPRFAPDFGPEGLK